MERSGNQGGWGGGMSVLRGRNGWNLGGRDFGTDVRVREGDSERRRGVEFGGRDCGIDVEGGTADSVIPKSLKGGRISKHALLLYVLWDN